MKPLDPTLEKGLLRLQEDFETYAKTCLNIADKSGHIIPFYMNAAQRLIHSSIEAQKKHHGYVRHLIVKGRQQGGSTYAQARLFWQIAMNGGMQGFTLAHRADAAENLMRMARRFYTHCPLAFRPACTTNNQNRLGFGALGSALRYGSAGSDGLGRSDTLHLFHGSEVAYWPDAEAHLSGILQAIPLGQGTEVILESTSNGPFGLFYEMCMSATSERNATYKLIFVPWFLQGEYTLMPPPGFELTQQERVLAKQYGLSDGQIYWRRSKVLELGSHWRFCREYPASLDEAFNADMPGALWTRAMIDRNRVSDQKDNLSAFSRIVIAVDPAISHHKNSDETGIIVAARNEDGHAYILDDFSGVYSPSAWAKKTVDAYHKYEADSIVIEANQGGDMAVHTIKTCDARLPIKKVYASRGKWSRAEPVAALDEQGRIHHVGHFPILEDQMCSFKPGQSQFSPDRVDARVWAITDLLLNTKHARPAAW